MSFIWVLTQELNRIAPEFCFPILGFFLCGRGQSYTTYFLTVRELAPFHFYVIEKAIFLPISNTYTSNFGL